MAVYTTSHPDSPSLRKPRQLNTLFFLNTTPFWDVCALLYGVPLWWVLGIDQFIWPIVLTWSLFKSLLHTNFRLRVSSTILWLALFLVVYLISGLFIVEPFRTVSFARNFSLYYSAFCLLLITTEWCKSEKQLRQLILALVFATSVSAVLGVLAVWGVFRPQFDAPISYLLPESIKSTGLGNQIATRIFGVPSWFSYFGHYYRLTGFALFSTYYGSLLMVVIPFCVLLVRWAKGCFLKAFFLAMLAAIVINLIYTTARLAMIGSMVGFIYFVGSFVYNKLWHRVALVFLGALLVVGSWFFFLVQPESSRNTVTSLVDNVLYSRGEGSVVSRMLVYRITLDGWLERPVFGWGTERDLPESRFPAGSHSYYFAVLYKQGAVGLAIFIALITSIWRNTAPERVRRTRGSPFQLSVLKYGRWTLVALAINSLTTAMDVDALTMITVWTAIAILLIAGTKKLELSHNRNAAGEPERAGQRVASSV